MSKYEIVFSIVEEAYKQEQERLKALNQKADNLTKYVSIFLVLLNIVIPMIVKYTSISLKFSLIMYILVCVPCMLSLFFAIREQKLSIMCRFPTGGKILEIADNKVTSEDDWIVLKTTQYEQAIEVLEDNNDSKVNDVKRGYNCYAFSIVMFTFFTLVVIILGYFN